MHGHGLAIRGALLAALMAIVPLWYGLAATPAGHLVVQAVPVSYVLLMGMLLAVCASSGDLWAGLLGAYLILRMLVTPFPDGFNTVVFAILGLGLYAGAGALGNPWRLRLRCVALAVGLVQAAWVIAHAAGLPGFTWGAWSGGTLGNSNYAGAYLAIASVWSPVWLLPAFAIGILATKSFLAALAATAAAAVRFPWGWRWILSGGAFVALAWWHRGGGLQPVFERLLIWRWAVTEWARGGLVFGKGIGSWGMAQPRVGQHQRFDAAHNDLLQLGYEGGLVALALVGAWLWSHRRAFQAPESAALLAAVLIESLGMFPFQLPAVAVLALPALAFATRRAP